MAYIVSPTLGMQLADPTTIQNFETPVVNNNFLALESGIVADRVRLVALEALPPALATPTLYARGQSADWLVVDAAALTALDKATVGDVAWVTTPGTGIDPFSVVALAGAGNTIDWRIIDRVIADTKAHLDSFIDAWNNDADLLFQIGAEVYVAESKMTYRITAITGTYTPARAFVDAVITSAVASVGLAPIDPDTGAVAFSGITTGGTLRINIDKTLAATARRVIFIIDSECGAGQTVSYATQLANAAAINSTAASYIIQGAITSAGANSVYSSAGAANWGAIAPRRYSRMRYEFSDLTVATKETTAQISGRIWDAALANFIAVDGGSFAHNLSAAADFDGLLLTFTVSGGLTAFGTVRVELEF